MPHGNGFPTPARVSADPKRGRRKRRPEPPDTPRIIAWTLGVAALAWGLIGAFSRS